MGGAGIVPTHADPVVSGSRLERRRRRVPVLPGSCAGIDTSRGSRYTLVPRALDQRSSGTRPTRLLRRRRPCGSPSLGLRPATLPSSSCCALAFCAALRSASARRARAVSAASWPDEVTPAVSSMLRTVRPAVGLLTYVGSVIGTGSHSEPSSASGAAFAFSCASAASSCAREIDAVSSRARSGSMTCSSAGDSESTTTRARACDVRRTEIRAMTRKTTISRTGAAVDSHGTTPNAARQRHRAARQQDTEHRGGGAGRRAWRRRGSEGVSIRLVPRLLDQRDPLLDHLQRERLPHSSGPGPGRRSSRRDGCWPAHRGDGGPWAADRQPTRWRGRRRSVRTGPRLRA